MNWKGMLRGIGRVAIAAAPVEATIPPNPLTRNKFM